MAKPKSVAEAKIGRELLVRRALAKSLGRLPLDERTKLLEWLKGEAPENFEPAKEE